MYIIEPTYNLIEKGNSNRGMKEIPDKRVINYQFSTFTSMYGYSTTLFFLG